MQSRGPCAASAKVLVGLRVPAPQASGSADRGWLVGRPHTGAGGGFSCVSASGGGRGPRAEVSGDGLQKQPGLASVGLPEPSPPISESVRAHLNDDDNFRWRRDRIRFQTLHLKRP